MFSNVKEFVDKSETIKEARINVKDMRLGKEIGLYLALYAVSMLLMMTFGAIFLGISESDFLSTIFYLFSFIYIPILIYLIATKIEKRSWRSIGFSKGNAISSTLKGLLIGFLMFSAVVAIGLILGQFRFEGLNISSAIYIVPFMIGFAIQSFGEEIFNRGWTMTYFSKRHSVLIGMVVSSIAFVIPHLFSSTIDLLSVINIFLFGIVFALLFLRFDNIWICGGAHAAWNISEGVIFGFSVSGFSTPSILKCSGVGQNIINGGGFGPESSLIATIVVVITIILVVYWKKSDNK